MLLLLLLPGWVCRAGAWKTVEEITFHRAEVLSEHAVRLPFELAGHLLAFEATIDGVTGKLVLDTGSETLLLNGRHFEGETDNDLLAYGQTGAVEQVSTSRVNGLQWGQFRLHRLDGHVIDLSHVEDQKHLMLLGMLGFSALEEFEVFIDFFLQQITLVRLNKQGERLDTNAILEFPEDSLAFRRSGHFIVLEGEVDGKPLTMALDTGAEINLLDRRVPPRVRRQFRILKRSLLTGAGGQRVEVLAGNLFRLRVAHRRYGPMQTLLTNMDEINEICPQRLDGILGYPFFAHKRMAINYRKETLYFFQRYKP